MGNAAGQLADHLHLACLVKLRQGAFALGEHGRDTFFQAFVEFAQLVLGAYPRADVHAHAEQAAGGMLLVHQRRDLVLHPHRIAVGANVAAAHLERRAGRSAWRRGEGEVGGVEDVLHAQAEQGLARTAGDLAVAIVDPGEAPVPVAYRDARAGLVEHRRQLRGTGAQRQLRAGMGERGPGQLGGFLRQAARIFAERLRMGEVDRQQRLQPAVAQHRDVQRGAQPQARAARRLVETHAALPGEVFPRHAASGMQFAGQGGAERQVAMPTDRRAAVVEIVAMDLEGHAVAVVLAEEYPRRAQLLAEPAQGGGFDFQGIGQGRQGLAQFQEERLAAFKTHPLGGLGDDAQHAADGTVGFPHRRIGHVEIDRLAAPVAFDVEGPILCREGLAGLVHPAQQRFEVIPQLPPVLYRRPTEGARMLVADARRVGIVVQGDEFRAPEQHDLRLGRQQRGHRRLQARRPGVRRAEGRTGRVEAEQQFPDRSSVGQEGRWMVEGVRVRFDGERLCHVCGVLLGSG